MSSGVRVSLACFALTLVFGCHGGGSGGSTTTSNPALTGPLGDVLACTRSNRLVSFQADAPQRLLTSRTISGLIPGESVLAICGRPSTGELYALGATSRIYRVDSESAVATQVGNAPFSPALNSSTATFDVDPVADVLRVVSPHGVEFTVDPETGAFLSPAAPLAYAANDSNYSHDPDLTGIAFTHEFAGATSSTLYGIDSAASVMVAVDAASGTLHSVHALDVVVNGVVGIDLSAAGGALMSATMPGAEDSQLYTLDIATGKTHLHGTIGAHESVRSIAFRPSAPPRIFGLTDVGQIVSFSPGRPGSLFASRAVIGLASGESLLAIDISPGDGHMYGLGSANHMYSIDTSSGVATPISAEPFKPYVESTSADIDCDPVSGAVRIIGSNGQDLQVKLSQPVVVGVGQPLSFAAGDPNYGAPPKVAAIAFSDDSSRAAHTTLYGIDSGLGALIRIGSPGGTPDSPDGGAVVTIGALGIETGGQMGLDIDAQGAAFAVLETQGSSASTLAVIDLTTGAARPLGLVAGASKLRSIAVELPTPTTIYAVDKTNQLVSFRADDPETLLSAAPISGLDANDSILAIDFESNTRRLLALAGTKRIYAIDTLTAHATPLGSAFNPSLAGARSAIDIDPVTNELRVVSVSDENRTFSTEDGQSISTDATLFYAPGDPNFGADPSIASIAFSNSFIGAAETTLYAIDSRLGNLVVIGGHSNSMDGPASGHLTTLGGLGFETTDLVGFDIDADGIALATLNAPNAPQSVLARIDLATGAATAIGKIAGAPLRDMAILPHSP